MVWFVVILDEGSRVFDLRLGLVVRWPIDDFVCWSLLWGFGGRALPAALVPTVNLGCAFATPLPLLGSDAGSLT